MKLLSEELDTKIECLVEGSGADRKLFIEGIFAQAEVANRNKRIYPLQVLANEVRRYTNENITPGRAWGELGHPSGPNVGLDRVCILIKEMRQHGNDFHGKALVTATPMGNVLKGLMESGGKIGVSTRALGSLKEGRGGLKEVAKDLRLLAVDVVADPSAPNAFVNSIMENADWIYNVQTDQYVNANAPAPRSRSFNATVHQHIIQEQTEDMRRRMMRMTMRELEQDKMKLFHDFISMQEKY
jgi:hypothetical protein